MAAENTSSRIGQGLTLGNYVVGELLGEGGFGRVYEGRHRLTHRQVAIKVFRPGDEGERKRFLQEAEVTQRLRHPNVVTIYDVGLFEASGELYIVMERLLGHDLSAELKENGPLERERALRLFVDCLEGLNEAHTLPQPIVHKDLKPSNLFLTRGESEQLIILDFGIARLLPETTVETRERSKLRDELAVTSHRAGTAPPGTPPYWAPEYIEDTRRVSPALDVYQMGLILGEALSGERVVKASSVFMYLMAHTNRDGFGFAESVRADAGLLPILERATALDPKQRYLNAGAFADALRSLLGARSALPVFPMYAATASGQRAAVTEGAFEDLRDAFVHKTTLDRLNRLWSVAQQASRWRDLFAVLGQVVDGARDVEIKRAILAARAQIAEHHLDDEAAAVEAWTACMDLEPSDPAPLEALERIHTAHEQWDDLAEVYERVARSSPQVELLEALLALYRDRLSDPEAALGVCQRILKMAPDHPHAHRSLVELWRRAGRWELLAAHYARRWDGGEEGEDRRRLRSALKRLIQATSEAKRLTELKVLYSDLDFGEVTPERCLAVLQGDVSRTLGDKAETRRDREPAPKVPPGVMGEVDHGEGSGAHERTSEENAVKPRHERVPTQRERLAEGDEVVSRSGWVSVRTVVGVALLLVVGVPVLAMLASEWSEGDGGSAADSRSQSDGDEGASEDGTIYNKGMVMVPAGEFIMGSGRFEKPHRKVYLDVFWIDVHEVTVDAYAACVRAGECGEPARTRTNSSYCNWGYEDRGNHPINCVTWQQAVDFCEWKGRRLPTEAEWEKAARGTDGKTYPWGEEKASCSRAVMDDGGDGCGEDRTWEVGSKPEGVSPYGAHDMAGNVWEWVSDWYDSDYYAEAPMRNPEGPPSGSYRVSRGGGWYFSGVNLRAANRGFYAPSHAFHYLGFRCAGSTE
ncbi:MAG: hypothetical protein CMH57_14845 [Myxococcales bacterium]|nr:hypothetical protein [Myxococcales bacterium]